jgi:hypothetical protein
VRGGDPKDHARGEHELQRAHEIEPDVHAELEQIRRDPRGVAAPSRRRRGGQAADRSDASPTTTKTLTRQIARFNSLDESRSTDWTEDQPMVRRRNSSNIGTVKAVSPWAGL